MKSFEAPFLREYFSYINSLIPIGGLIQLNDRKKTLKKY